MGYERENGTMVQDGEYDVLAVYEFIVVQSEGIIYEAYYTPEEAAEAARDWLIAESGATDAEVSEVGAMTDSEVEDKILDYDYVSFCDVAHRRILFG